MSDPGSYGDHGDTTATSADPEIGAEGDTNQLEAEDTLLDRGVDNVMDEGFVTAEKPSRHRLEVELAEIDPPVPADEFDRNQR